MIPENKNDNVDNRQNYKYDCLFLFKHLQEVVLKVHSQRAVLQYS